jgi:hypothetical protein
MTENNPPPRRLPRHLWSDALLEAITSVDISKLATHYGRIVQINNTRRRTFRNQGQEEVVHVIVEHLPAASPQDTQTYTAPRPPNPGPTPSGGAHEQVDLGPTPGAAANTSRRRITDRGDSAGAVAAAKSAGTVTAQEPTMGPASHITVVNCPVCPERMPENEIADHVDKTHPPAPPDSFQNVPIATPIEQLPAYAMGPRTQSQRHLVPVMPVPVYGYPPPHYTWPGPSSSPVAVSEAFTRYLVPKADMNQP